MIYGAVAPSAPLPWTIRGVLRPTEDPRVRGAQEGHSVSRQRRMSRVCIGGVELASGGGLDCSGLPADMGPLTSLSAAKSLDTTV